MGATDFIWVEEQGRVQISTGFAFAHQVCRAPRYRDSKTGARDPTDGSQLQVMTL
ncbi:hypothetical protein [Paraburkholderia sp. JPY419]|uniref:hypothetical protein n=1 Tax=Paraburkholderia sp. JPY419 TaxID=667660 RepID=UPI003D211FBE